MSKRTIENWLHEEEKKAVINYYKYRKAHGADEEELLDIMRHMSHEELSEIMMELYPEDF